MDNIDYEGVFKGKRVVYFSMEIGINSEFSTYSGGLGILAGDTVRSSADLWVGARNNNSFSLVIAGGEITLASALPTIDLLLGTRTTFTKLDIAISGFYADTSVGLWFGATSPVAITGTPDATIEVLENINAYSYEYTQAIAQYVSAACLTDTETGIPLELYLPFAASTVTSPEDQFAQP